MKKSFLIIIFLVTILLVPTSVKANRINKIDMDIYIDQNGDAHVKESWNYYSDKNTEIYHQYLDLGNSAIQNFNVSDSTGKQYNMLNNWDINASFDEKKYQAGINYVSNGVELCLGISHYGTYTYYLNYTITDFVSELNDAQMAYWTLLQPTSENLQNYYIKISADQAFSDDLPVWGFGSYGDTAYVYDGYIEMQSTDALNSNEYVVVLIKFPLETFKLDIFLSNDFDYYLNIAKEGSTAYIKEEESSTPWQFIFYILFSFGIFFPIIVIMVKKNSLGKTKLNKKTIPKDYPMFRDIPCDKDSFKAYFVASEYHLMKRTTDFLGAILLKWYKENLIDIQVEETDILKNKKTKIIFKKPEINPAYEAEADLYKMMYTASEDSILEQKEFEKWCNKNYKKLYDWFDNTLDEIRIKYVEEGLITKEEKKSLFKNYFYSATAKLDETAAQMAGLKLFFKEFSSLDDKRAIEVKLWEEYLIYAQIFGIATEVAKEFKKLYPDVIDVNQYDNIILINTFSVYAIRSMDTARSRAMSYSSGGGGFSSGGGGGGSFGGGGGGSMGSR